MQLYSAKVRNSGSLYNEVIKADLTVPEIVVLRHIHGQADPDTGDVGTDSVVDIKPTREVNRTDDEERQRLKAIYTPALKKKGKSIDTLLGIGVPLPHTTAGMGVVQPREPIKRKRRAKPAETTPAPEPEDTLAGLE